MLDESERFKKEYIDVNTREFNFMHVDLAAYGVKDAA